MDNDSAQKARPVSARRRLLRGAFSAPAALTLYSGGAIAAASNRHCVMNLQGGNAVDLPPVATTNETYVRIGLYPAGTTAPFTYWIKGTELQLFSLYVGPDWPESAKYQQFNIDPLVNAFIGGPAGEPSNLGLSPSHWAALRINGDGVVVGVGASGVDGGSAIYQSCWTSFKVGGL